MGDKRNETKRKGWWLGVAGVYLLSKLKFLLAIFKYGKFGGAIISMFISIGFYALLFPFGFAVGLVVMLLIHELGHVIAARIKKLPVSAPVFIPFIGALIALKRNPRDAVTEAYVAMGGPLLGTVGAIGAFLLGMYMKSPLLIVIANTGFMLNLINLLPIHPLDGGRIATAVTRWLWILGVVGGLYVILWLKLWIFLLFWGLFTWDLYQKYVKNKGGNKPTVISGLLEVPLDPLIEQGMLIPGAEHKRQLPFTTYSDLSGQQFVEVSWESIGLEGLVKLPQQGIISKVHVTRVDRIPRENQMKLAITVQIDYTIYINDKYYDVPVASRWRFGLGYGGLAIALGFLMYYSRILLEQYRLL